MRTPDRPLPSRAALLLVLGAATWMPCRYGVMTTWDGTWLGLDYAGWNRAVLVPLALLAAGAVMATRDAPARAAAVGWSVVATGFGLSWFGVVTEFVVGGGLRGGSRDLAVAGWTTYLVGTAVTAVGALVLAAALAGRDRATAAAAGLAAVAILAWVPLLAVGPDGVAVVDQLIGGAAWAAVGLLGRSRSPAAPLPATA
ncbi:hypothetical protein [Blastococcus sp. DSM 46786]|uniref:hypothetical protein n=1 Tax=Blastococcus sp. DSM 46786 TaxID=1798227 RepID=UPI0011137CEA|nr:hypothetical protein [Blastococcus sp. DSM 46786]